MLPSIYTRNLNTTYICSDQADAAMAILEKRRRGEAPGPHDWRRLFKSRGQGLLRRRSAKFGIKDVDQKVKEFLLSRAALLRYAGYKRSLAIMRRADLKSMAAMASAYLPKGTPIKAPVYPLIKKSTNSWIFLERGKVSIGFYPEPGFNMRNLRNTLAHEFTHVGQIAAEVKPSKKLRPSVRAAIEWIGSFGEGFAMLAAAGGWRRSPCAAAAAEPARRWKNGMAHFDRDFKRIEKFLLAVADGRLSGEKAMKAGSAFFGYQGPWYTVGWRICAEVERRLGRGALLPFPRDPRTLLVKYNSVAAKSGLPVFCGELMRKLGCQEA